MKPDVIAEKEGSRYLISFVSERATTWAESFVDPDAAAYRKGKLVCTQDEMHSLAVLLFDAELDLIGADEFVPMLED